MTLYGTATTQRPVALFCGPGNELNRHGLREFHGLRACLVFEIRTHLAGDVGRVSRLAEKPCEILDLRIRQPNTPV